VKNAGSADKFWEQMTGMRSRMGRSITIPGEDASADARAEFQKKMMAQVPGLVQLPGEEDQEGWDNLYAKIGRPDDPAKYSVPEVEGVQVPEESLAALRKRAHALGINKKQFEGWMKEELQAVAEQRSAEQAAIQEGLKGLKGEWGMAFDERTAVAEKVRATYMPHVPAEAMGAQTIKALYAIAQQLGGEALQVAGQQGGAPALTVQDAMDQIAEIRSNSQHPYHNKADPGHAAAREKMRKLYQAAYPQSGTADHVQFGVG
jgi:hypothetical protein